MEAQIDHLIRPSLEAQGIDLVELRVHGADGGTVLTLFVDRIDGPVDFDMLRKIDRSVESALEETAILPSGYRLEVSSPGLSRPLVSERDFERNIGRRLRVVMTGAAGEKPVFEGVLEAVDAGTIRLATDASGATDIQRSEIHKAKVVPDFAGLQSREDGSK